MRAFGLLLLLAVASAGCHGHDDCSGHSHDPVCLQCDGSEDAYDATRFGEQRRFQIQLLSTNREPHVVANDNALTILVKDADGTPLEGVTFDEVEPFYPAGHGSPTAPVVAPGSAAGQYEVTGIDYIHAGMWELRFELSAGGESDRIVFLLCVVDA